MTRSLTLRSPRLLALLAGTAFVFSASPSLADVKAGVDAWSAGNYEAAVNEWRVPAQNGDADAQFNLAQAYRLGRGVPADLNKARDLYAQAAEKGHLKASDNYGLLLFQQGDRTTAMPLIKAASDRGDARAQYILGLAHFNADYAEKDWVRAYALLTLAQSAGLPQATNALTEMDKYVPMKQRREAQTLARQLDTQAEQARAAQVAQANLQRVENAAPQPAAPAPTPVPVAITAAPQPIQTTPVPASTSRPSAAASRAIPASDGPWRVQLGAFGVAGNADRLWNRLSTNAALAGKRKFLVPGGSVTRLQAGGFADRASAQRACNTLKGSGQACLVVRR